MGEPLQSNSRPGPMTALLAHAITGAAVGWLIWYVCPPWLRGK